MSIAGSNKWLADLRHSTRHESAKFSAQEKEVDQLCDGYAQAEDQRIKARHIKQ